MGLAVITKSLGLLEYTTVWEQQRAFTVQRGDATLDEFWSVEHVPVFTQGKAGRAEHILDLGGIPLVQSDRGGQVTYHAPGQLVVYLLIDLVRKKSGLKGLVTALQDSVIKLLHGYGIVAELQIGAPGVYVSGAKIAALGLRVHRGRTYHGLSLNVNLDLAPFQRINPCGYAGLAVTQVSALGGPSCVATVNRDLLAVLAHELGYSEMIAI